MIKISLILWGLDKGFYSIYNLIIVTVLPSAQ